MISICPILDILVGVRNELINKKKLIPAILSLVLLSIAYLMIFSSNGKIVSASFNMKEVAPKFMLTQV